jgi:hypothetical protein
LIIPKQAIAAFGLLVLVIVILFAGTIPNVLAQENGASTDGSKDVTIVISNSDVLQACATALIGVLIFLTLERRLPTEDFDLMKIHLEARVEELKTEVVKDSDEYGNIEKKLQSLDKIAKEKYEKTAGAIGGTLIDTFDIIGTTGKSSLDIRKRHLEEKITKNQTEVRNSERQLEWLNKRISSDRLTIQYQENIKTIEDVSTIATVTLLSACIIFILFISPNYTGYSNISRLLFALGIAALVVRVFFSTKDARHHFSIASDRFKKSGT